MPLLSCDLSTKSDDSMGIGARRVQNAHVLVPGRHAMRGAAMAFLFQAAAAVAGVGEEGWLGNSILKFRQSLGS